ncbi:dihydrofolate reductase family protein [Staphylococcus sp. ACRSN]|uniref:dihydrofolate reductase family protein n=1 Tax=Staphylococcus sp. ACRSN TaxID=2918214 RepID=UPI001EF343AB|nr:dihydrofolate reductase family protein [Staphylococcus sp. ACRSN]MCG7339918.1 dihydrofolate reductase family protein [Staphylococcus sp. ACRSN]
MTIKLKQRKIILDLAISLDGFIEGKNGEIDWCIMDPEMEFTNFLNQIDTILYGRKSYDLWGQYTPSLDASDEEKEMWDLVHRKDKYVFSKTQTSSAENVIFINENIADQVNKLTHKPGGNIWLYGGSGLITTFIDLNLIDEYRLSVHPVVLGEGKPLFENIKQRLNLTLVHTNTFSSGVVQLIYRPNKS